MVFEVVAAAVEAMLLMAMVLVRSLGLIGSVAVARYCYH